MKLFDTAHSVQPHSGWLYPQLNKKKILYNVYIKHAWNSQKTR